MNSMQRWWRRLRKRLRKPVTLTGRNYVIARRMLLDVVEVCNAMGVEYALDSGTLLGLARAGDLIPWDNDLDITLPITEVEKFRKTFPELKRRGWRITDHYPMQCDAEAWKRGDLRSIKIRNRNILWFGRGRIVMDVFITYPHDKAVWWVMLGKICRVSDEFFKNLEQIEFGGHACKVPGNYPALLAIVYGPDWRIPNPDFVPKHQDGSILRSVTSVE